LNEDLLLYPYPMMKWIAVSRRAVHKSQKFTHNIAKREAVKAASSFLESVSITPKKIDHGVKMLTRIHDEYQALYFAVLNAF